MSRLRGEQGMTIVEMLIAITIMSLISLAGFALIDFTMRRSGEISGRVDADQRGRVAMDAITRQLRSQVCQPSGTPPMYSRAGNTTDDNDATFFVDLTDGSDATKPAELHTLAYVPYASAPTKGSIVERDYSGTLNSNPAIDPSYGTTPYATRTLLADVAPVDGKTPIFSYYDFSGNKLATPVTGAPLGSIARIQVAYRSLPSRGSATDRGAVVFQDQVSVREVDPNATDPEPDCE
jgi:prepilin-type N-terminal cleavage/methylation domain-containing protein